MVEVQRCIWISPIRIPIWISPLGTDTGLYLGRPRILLAAAVSLLRVLAVVPLHVLAS